MNEMQKDKWRNNYKERIKVDKERNEWKNR
jgi:hypothetical protein